MLLTWWLDFMRSNPHGASAKRWQGGQRGSHRLRARLHLEPLEGRCLLASGQSASLVADLVSGPNSSNPQNLANVNGTLYFATSNPTTGTELWKSDGTAAGTVLLANGFNSLNAPLPQDFTWF